MRIIEQSFETLSEEFSPFYDHYRVYRKIEEAARVCYKSEHKITDHSATEFVKNLIERKHEAMLEHVSFSVKFIVDRGVSHELVRHRLAAFAQESTRYCNYSDDKFNNELTFIKPPFFSGESRLYTIWENSMEDAEQAYLSLLDLGASPQEARSVLPNSLKTEVVVTANIREWRHIFKLRCSVNAHPQMREIMMKVFKEFAGHYTILFMDCV